MNELYVWRPFIVVLDSCVVFITPLTLFVFHRALLHFLCCLKSKVFFNMTSNVSTVEISH